MAYVNVTIRMDKDEKDRAEKLFSEFGLTMNAAFNMFAKQALREESIPFIEKISTKCLKNRSGTIAKSMRSWPNDFLFLKRRRPSHSRETH